MGTVETIKSIIYFVLASLCEIGGGYLIWLWLREVKHAAEALIGATVLVIYGIISTFQPANFCHVYKAYGGSRFSSYSSAYELAFWV